MSDDVSVEQSGEERPVPIIAVGASAGGLRPLESLFEHVPSDSAAAFVVVQHLSPDFKSMMPELLARQTTLKVEQVTSGVRPQAGHIYLLPPRHNIQLEADGTLSLQRQPTGRYPNFPIDVFFRSLAEHSGPRSMGVVLSGTGSDGTDGVRAINEAGGVVFVQHPETAQFDGMPRSAIATGLADYVLSPAQIAWALGEHLQPRPSLLSPQAGVDDEDQEVLESLSRISRLLSQNNQLDFSHYKPSTLRRRIERRFLISGATTLDDYIEMLGDSEEERELLRRDLLICVTRFFRDEEMWWHLRHQALPALVKRLGEDEPLRLWVTACSTGEEAYSMAICVDEVLTELGDKRDVKIFATDVNRAALEVASAGLYAGTISHDVSSERLSRFFERRGDQYQIRRDLREQMIFAPHDLTRAAPFTKMHVVSCRNVLIYMQSRLQEHVLRMLHFALVKDGLLVLGQAETLGHFEREFSVPDRRLRARSTRAAASRRRLPS